MAAAPVSFRKPRVQVDRLGSGTLDVLLVGWLPRPDDDQQVCQPFVEAAAAERAL